MPNITTPTACVVPYAVLMCSVHRGLFFVIDNPEWFTEIVVDNLLPGLRFSTSDGFWGRFNCDSRRRRNVSMTSFTGVRCCGFPVKIGVLMGEIASSTALTPCGTARISPPRSRYDRVCDSSRRRMSCFDGGFFTVLLLSISINPRPGMTALTYFCKCLCDGSTLILSMRAV